ncbi:hypothetical protein OH77DRAFT_510171 [Trametes cingulata]|nr:hypothetical protein OH77DRAFT_510171 [Trametes cingulata]
MRQPLESAHFCSTSALSVVCTPFLRVRMRVRSACFPLSLWLCGDRRLRHPRRREIERSNGARCTPIVSTVIPLPRHRSIEPRTHTHNAAGSQILREIGRDPRRPRCADAALSCDRTRRPPPPRDSRLHTVAVHSAVDYGRQVKDRRRHFGSICGTEERHE